ncbi:MAG: murein L,D-transpeptidase family protein [Cardiobacteriaceae bacterium]|nr:murein L,D-transpeptidase family protein [Cardiobacteriaceae bacterium]
MKNKLLHLLALMLLVVGCSRISDEGQRDSRVIRRPQQLTLQDRMEAKGFRFGAPAFIRIFKKEEVLEVWLQKDSGEYALFLDYPICIYSGELGPKTREGDKQSPEGFYRVGREALNPNSNYHLSFNLGYPNTYDRAHGYSGSMLMVHGKCVSIGCYAMGDRQIEEIYTLVGSALQRGQPFVYVNAFPFRLTDANLAAYSDNRWYDFWRMLKPGYDYFERYHRPPEIDVVDGRYQLSSRNPMPAVPASNGLPPVRSSPIIPVGNINANPLPHSSVPMTQEAPLGLSSYENVESNNPVY